MPIIYIHSAKLEDLKRRKDQRSSWHGKECELLGIGDYAVIRFPEHGRYEYELCDPRWVNS